MAELLPGKMPVFPSFPEQSSGMNPDYPYQFDISKKTAGETETPGHTKPGVVTVALSHPTCL